ncbi:MAG: hypothetical protein HY657_00385 [Acidobacteria bacterium]|nr:hypothetical protein [Acidobacteriota bacterium]
MRGVKRYTNATFTKRVDHDGGRHRPPRPPSEPALCPGCGAVYVRKHWSHRAPGRAIARRADQPLIVRVCASCRTRRTGVPHGFLHIDGEFFALHREELERLLRNEADQAREDNPLNQVLAWEDLGAGTLLITTSTEHLAQRLGRALEKAYDGEVHYGFSHENKLAHVWWHR